MGGRNMATISLPRVIVIKSKAYGSKGHAYFKADGASVVLGEEDILSTLVKIDVERSITNANYVNLKFGYFNRYWRRKENDKFIIAESNQVEEDVSKPSCTLFGKRQITLMVLTPASAITASASMSEKPSHSELLLVSQRSITFYCFLLSCLLCFVSFSCRYANNLQIHVCI
ncbi:uncharacterized protein LOC125203263 [Salvia hispanica]|uniref:uncharacterized protein LOC125203263 n=1 Tax=Salvia hispanica TaxID=49212 RepID=UPI002009984B|nr:uncharacterized protein LOC125203263 [Salvia hispanica]